MDFDVGALIASFCVSGVGFVLFYYGRKMKRMPQLLVGLVLMVFPYFVSNTWLILGIGALLSGGLWYGLKSGMFY